MKKILLLLLIAPCIGAMEPKRVIQIKEQEKVGRDINRPENSKLSSASMITAVASTSVFMTTCSILPFPPGIVPVLAFHAAVIGSTMAFDEYNKYMSKQSNIQQNQDKNQ